MRVLYVHSTRSGLGDSIRAEKIRSFLKKRGFEVHEKWINTKKLRAIVSGLAGLRYFLSDEDKYDVRKIKSPKQILAKSFFKSIQRQILKVSISIKPDIIIAETSPVGYFSLLAKEKLDIPIVTDVHGFIGKESAIRRSEYTELICSIEASSFRGSDYLLAVSNPMKQQIFSKFDITEDKVLVVPNGGDVLSFSAHFNLPLNVILGGNFAAYEKISDFLKIAKDIGQKSNFAFFLMGDGIEKKEILLRIKREKIPIRYLGLKTRREALRIFSVALPYRA